jgi:hypothetical protein
MCLQIFACTNSNDDTYSYLPTYLPSNRVMIGTCTTTMMRDMTHHIPIYLGIENDSVDRERERERERESHLDDTAS